MVDQPHRQRARQHQLALGHGDEGVAQPVKPELRAACLADTVVEVSDTCDMPSPALGGRKHPAFRLYHRAIDVGQSTLEDGGELPGDRKLQRLPGLGLLDPQDAPVQVDPVPAQRNDLAPAHAGVEANQEDVADRRFQVERIDTRPPARQHLGRRRNSPTPHSVEAPAGGQPQLDRIAQTLVVDTVPAVDRAQHRHRLVGRGPAVLAGDEIEPVLDILAGDAVQRTLQPV